MNNLGRVVREAHRTMIKLHNIVVLTIFTPDMFQAYRMLFINGRGDDIFNIYTYKIYNYIYHLNK